MSLLGAIAAIVGSVAGGYLGHNLNEQAQQRSYYDSKRLMDYENQYNLPEKQVARMEAAGLNPKFFLGSGGGSVPSASPSGPTMATNRDVGDTDVLAKLSTMQSIRNLRADEALTRTRQSLLQEQAESAHWRTRLTKAQLVDAIESLKYYRRTGIFRDSDWKRGAMQAVFNLLSNRGTADLDDLLSGFGGYDGSKLNL